MTSPANDRSRMVELRVHGVSGTPPEQLLDCPLVEQVGGDREAGFYRPRLLEERGDPRATKLGPDAVPVDPGHGPVLEGYAWGGLTSGASTRALWLLLLPFTFINVAPRLRPAGPALAGKPPINLWILWFVSRLLAVSMTALLVMAMSGVGVDLFGWQCATGRSDRSPSCAAASPQWIMKPLVGLSLEHRMLVGGLVPLVVLMLLWKASDRTINQYEGVPSIFDDVNDPNSDVVEPTLRSRWMWRNEYLVRRLRHLHLQAGLVATLWVITAAFDWGWVSVVRVVGLSAAAAYIVAMLCWPAYTGRQPRPRFKLANQLVWGVLLLAAVGVAVALGFSHPLVTRTPGVALPDYAGSALTVFLSQLVLFLLFVGAIGVMAFRGRRSAAASSAPRSLGDCSAVMLCALGVFLGAALSAGVYIYSAAWMGTGSIKPGFGEVSLQALSFDVPDVIRDAARAYAVAVAALIVLIAAAAAFFLVNRVLRWVKLRRWPSSGYAAILAHDYPMYASGDLLDPTGEPAEKLDDSYGTAESGEVRAARAKTVARTMWLARQVDHAHRYLAVLVGTGLVIMIAFVLLLLDRTRTSFWPWGDVHLSLSGPISRWHDYCNGSSPCTGRTGAWWTGYLSAQKLQGTGAYLAVITLLLMVSLGAAVFRVQKTRKTVGILWDLASFWPRSAHPFAAPCYAERAVPDLTTRIFWLTRQNPRFSAVILSAHSQGTVLSAATLFQLQRCDQTRPSEPQIIPRVAYLSFGCVLRRLYTRYFPAYFSPSALATIGGMLTSPGGDTRWRNLWRHSDYLGGQVTAGPPPTLAGVAAEGERTSDIEVQLIDPAWPRPHGDTRYPAASMHSDYWRDQEFAIQIGELADRLPD